MPAPPSIGRVLKRDWPALILLVLVAAWWGVTGAAWGFGVARPDDEEARAFAVIFTLAGIALTAAGVSVSAWRIRTIRRVFATGDEVEGRVAYVGENSEDIGYAIVAYVIDGREYRVTNVTEGAPDRGGLAAGQTVRLVVDPLQPSRAYLVDLYGG